MKRTSLLIAIVGLVIPLKVLALDFDYAKIADTSTASPSGGLFSLVDYYPAFDGQSVAFYAESGTPKGIYVGSGGGLTKIADNSTTIPGGSGTFSSFYNVSAPSISNGKVAFAANDSAHSGPGVYTNVGGGLTTVADSTTPLPSGSGTFTNTGEVSLDGSNVAFYGQGVGGRLGIYSALGGLHKVANQNDLIPGGTGAFTNFSYPSMNGGNVAFDGYGSSSQQGIYSDVGGTVHAVANMATPIPNGIGSFTAFSNVSLSAGNVAFAAYGSGSQSGIYSDVGGTLQAIADTSTAVPNGSGLFTVFVDYVSLNQGSVAFRGSGSGGQGGIFTNYGGAVPVVTNGTLIDGKTVSTLSMSARGLNNGNVAFEAGFSGGAGSGIYVAEQSYDYTANTSGAWDTAGNWSFSLKPRTAVYANIHPTSGIVVTGPSSATTIRGLDLGATSSGQAELRLQSSGQLSMNEYLYVETLGKLSVNGGVATAAAGIYNYGEIDLGSGGQINGGFFQNSGTLHGSGTVGNYVYNLATIQANNATQHYTDQVFNNAQVQIINSQVQIDSLTSNQFSPSDGVFGRIDVRNSLVAFNGGLSNIGSLNFSFGTSDVFGHIDNGLLPPADPVGQIIVSGNSNVTFYDAVVHNGTLFRVSPGSTAIFFGPVSGDGAFTGGGTKIFEGGYSPGNSPAAVSLAGPVTLGSTNTLKIELGGTTAGTQYDKVQVTGALSLDGSLQVALISNFTPVRGNKFDILDWTTHTGTFLALQLPALVSPLRWNIGQLYVDGTLSVVDSTRLPGDFNRDTQVTGADIPVMLSALANLPGYEQLYDVSDSDLLAIGDFDSSGSFTNADMQGLLYLLSHGGIVLGSPSPASPVPEPTSIVLLGLGGLAIAFCRRSR